MTINSGGEEVEGEFTDSEDDQSILQTSSNSKKRKKETSKSNSNVQARKEQNRLAQREFRQRKQQYIKDLEARVELLSSSKDDQIVHLREGISALIEQNKQLRKILVELSKFVGAGANDIATQMGFTGPEFEVFLKKNDQDTLSSAIEKSKAKVAGDLFGLSGEPKAKRRKYNNVLPPSVSGSALASTSKQNGNGSGVDQTASSVASEEVLGGELETKVLGGGGFGGNGGGTTSVGISNAGQSLGLDFGTGGGSINGSHQPHHHQLRNSSSSSSFSPQTHPHTPPFPRTSAPPGTSNLGGVGGRSNSMNELLNQRQGPIGGGNSNGTPPSGTPHPGSAPLVQPSLVQSIPPPPQPQTAPQYGMHGHHPQLHPHQPQQHPHHLGHFESPSFRNQELQAQANYTPANTTAATGGFGGGRRWGGPGGRDEMTAYAMMSVEGCLNEARKEGRYPLPQSLMPTFIQQQNPHDPEIDKIIWHELRDRMILYGNANDVRSVIQEYKNEVICHARGGDEVFDPSNWELGERFLRNYWNLIPDEVVICTNRWRRERGENAMDPRELIPVDAEQAAIEALAGTSKPMWFGGFPH